MFNPFNFSLNNLPITQSKSKKKAGGEKQRSLPSRFLCALKVHPVTVKRTKHICHDYSIWFLIRKLLLSIHVNWTTSIWYAKFGKWTHFSSKVGRKTQHGSCLPSVTLTNIHSIIATDSQYVLSFPLAFIAKPSWLAIGPSQFLSILFLNYTFMKFEQAISVLFWLRDQENIVNVILIKSPLYQWQTSNISLLTYN